MRYRSDRIRLGAVALALALPCSPVLAQRVDKPHAPVCADAAPGNVWCHSRIIIDNHGKPSVVKPYGRPPRGSFNPPYGPSELRTAYRLTGQAPGLPIIAIVVAFDAPHIASDLATYSTHYGFPQLPD